MFRYIPNFIRKFNEIHSSTRDTAGELRRVEQRLAQLETEVSRPAPQRVAIVSCITNNFIDYGKAFLASLAETKSVPKNADVILLTCPTYAPLSDVNKDILRTILPSAQFEAVDTRFLNKELVKRWKGGKIVKANIDARLPDKKSVYLKLHVLRMAAYDAVLWLDSDMIVQRSIAGLFRTPADISVVPVGEPVHAFGLNFGRAKTGFNSGLMLIRRRYLSLAWFDKAVGLLRAKQHTTVQDQSLLNHLWRDEEKMFLPHVYNWKVPRGGSREFHERAMDEARVVHFVGPSKNEIIPESDLPLHRQFYRLCSATSS